MHSRLLGIYLPQLNFRCREYHSLRPRSDQGTNGMDHGNVLIALRLGPNSERGLGAEIRYTHLPAGLRGGMVDRHFSVGKGKWLDAIGHGADCPRNFTGRNFPGFHPHHFQMVPRNRASIPQRSPRSIHVVGRRRRNGNRGCLGSKSGHWLARNVFHLQHSRTVVCRFVLVLVSKSSKRA